MNLKTCTKHTAPKEIKVPNLVGMTKEAALAALEKLKLVAKVIEKNVDGVAAGVVAEPESCCGEHRDDPDRRDADRQHRRDLQRRPDRGLHRAIDGEARREGGARRIARPKTTARSSSGTGSSVTAPPARAETTSHAWVDPGTYEVTLWVTDNDGQQASITKTIKIN